MKSDTMQYLQKMSTISQKNKNKKNHENLAYNNNLTNKKCRI